MAQENSLKRMFRTFRIALAFVLVHITYNPWSVSYYHWSIKPWWDQLFGTRAVATSGPNSIKAFLGVVLLGGWFFYLRSTRRKIGTIGIIITLAFFLTLSWVLSDFGLFPRMGSMLLQHIFLMVLSLILSLGVILPEPRAKTDLPKQKPVPKGSEEAA